MNRANGTITVTATNYKPNSRLGCGMPYGPEKRQPPVNLADRIEIEFLVFVNVGEFGGVRRLFLKGTNLGFQCAVRTNHALNWLAWLVTIAEP